MDINTIFYIFCISVGCVCILTGFACVVAAISVVCKKLKD